MNRAISYRKAGFVAILLATGLVALAACSNQGEGERCSVLNGDDDCQTDEGLVCYPAAQLNNAPSDRCCPRDRAKATAVVCLTPVAVIGADAATPADTGPPPEPTPAFVEDAGDEDASGNDGLDAGADADADAG